MRLAHLFMLLASMPLVNEAAADPGPSEATVARAVSAGTLTIVDAGGGLGLHWAAWADQTTSGRTVRLALFDGRTAPSASVWTQSWPDAYDPQLVQMTPWAHAGHPIYALTLRFGAEAQQLDLVSLDAGGRPVRLAEKLGAAIGLVLEAEKAAAIVYQTPKVALVPDCFEWREDVMALVEARCLN